MRRVLKLNPLAARRCVRDLSRPDRHVMNTVNDEHGNRQLAYIFLKAALHDGVKALADSSKHALIAGELVERVLIKKPVPRSHGLQSRSSTSSADTAR